MARTAAAVLCLAACAADAVLLARDPNGRALGDAHGRNAGEERAARPKVVGHRPLERSPVGPTAVEKLKAALAQLNAAGAARHRPIADAAHLRRPLALLAEEAPDHASDDAIDEIEEEAKRVVAEAEAQAASDGGVQAAAAAAAAAAEDAAALAAADRAAVVPPPPAAPVSAAAVGTGGAAGDDDGDIDDGEVIISKGDLAAAPAASPPTEEDSDALPPAGLAADGDKDSAEKDGDDKEDGEKDREKGKAGNSSSAEKDKDKDLDEEEVKREVDAELAKEDAFERKEQADREAAAADLKDSKEEKKPDRGSGPRGGQWEDKTEKLQKQIADDTHSKALSEMLTKVRMDTYMIRQKIDILEREISDGVDLEEPDPSESLVYPLSVCMLCILALAVQYFVVYTVLATCKVFIDCFNLGECTTIEVCLQGACDTVFYAPMLCVLFLGAQLRASQISQGRKEPPQVAQIGMEVCCASVLAQTLLVMAIPLFTGKAAAVGEDGIEMPSQENRAMAGLLMLIRYTAMAGLYIGFSVVCIMVVMMDTRMLGVHPVDIWDDPTTAVTEYAPNVSMAMKCTMVLTQLFFFVHLIHMILLSIVQLTGPTDSILPPPRSFARKWVLKWEQCFKACTQTVTVAPMVCTLFMAARMRSLELDPKDGRPQWWAEMLFKIITGAIIAQVVVVFLSAGAGVDPQVSANGAIARGTSGVDDGGKDLEELACAEASGVERFCIAFRGAAQFVAYACIVGVVVSIVVMRDKLPDAPPVPFAPTMMCVLMLVAMYFLIYVCLFTTQAVAMCIFSTATTMTHERVESLLRMVHLFKLAEYTIKLCPMMALLCLGVRERALDLSAYQGSPQCWAQDAMYVATFALLLQLLLVLVGGTFSSGVGVDEAGSPVTRGMKYVPGRVALEAAKGLAFMALYGGLAVVAFSVLTIRPETAGCVARGFHPLV